ncbi:MAG: 4'-phosphopantetheinyl transferase superfamily protein [Myxococcota bacterium]|nr:4'-phosphopantetheinyl transferase superfamily protein [Myxococcota bacterium]
MPNANHIHPQFSIIELKNNWEGVDKRKLLESGCAVVWYSLSDAWETEQQKRFWRMVTSNEEHDRASRFFWEEDRDVFLAAHGLLRITLSRYTDREPLFWRFKKDPLGKPRIVNASDRLSFSLTHTRGFVACVVTKNSSAGVDAECCARAAPLDVAESFFSNFEIMSLKKLFKQDRNRRFFEYWTLKESYLKAIGTGLNLPLNRFYFVPTTDGDWKIHFVDTSFSSGSKKYRFHSRTIDSRFQLSVAIIS